MVHQTCIQISQITSIIAAVPYSFQSVFFYQMPWNFYLQEPPILVLNDGHTQLFPIWIRPIGQMMFTRWSALFRLNDERKKLVKSFSCEGKASVLRTTAESIKMVAIATPLGTKGNLLNKLALEPNMMKNNYSRIYEHVFRTDPRFVDWHSRSRMKQYLPDEIGNCRRETTKQLVPW